MKKIARGLFAEPSVGVRFNCGSKRANVGIAYAMMESSTALQTLIDVDILHRCVLNLA